MLYQNADFEGIFIIAIVAAFALLRSENKTENKARPKDDVQSSSFVENLAKFLPKERPKIGLKLSQRAIRSLWGVPLKASLRQSPTGMKLQSQTEEKLLPSVLTTARSPRRAA